MKKVFIWERRFYDEPVLVAIWERGKRVEKTGFSNPKWR